MSVRQQEDRTFFHIFLPVIKFKKPCTGRPVVRCAECDAVHAAEFHEVRLTSSALFDLFSLKYIQERRLRGRPTMSSRRRHKTAGVFPRCALPAPVDFTDKRRSRRMCVSDALCPNTGFEAGFLPHRREGGMLVKKRAVAGNGRKCDKKDRHGVPGINASKENHLLIAARIMVNIFPGVLAEGGVNGFSRFFTVRNSRQYG